MTSTNYQSLQILPGAAGIKEVYRRSLQAKALDIICLSSGYESIIGDFFDKVYAPKLYDGNIDTREILTDNPGNRQTTRDHQQNQVRFLKLVKDSESDFLLFDNQLVLISYNPESPHALIITDPEIVSSFTSQFETLWSSLSN